MDRTAPMHSFSLPVQQFHHNVCWLSHENLVFSLKSLIILLSYSRHLCWGNKPFILLEDLITKYHFYLHQLAVVITSYCFT